MPMLLWLVWHLFADIIDSFQSPFIYIFLFHKLQPKDVQFEFPELYTEESKDEEKAERKTLDEMKSNFKEYVDKNKTRPNLPPWFSI